MKLSWKLFFVTMPVLILVLTVFGMWMLQTSFSDSLEREVEQCSLENKYAATSYILSKRAYEDISPGRYTEEEVVAGFHEATDERGASTMPRNKCSMRTTGFLWGMELKKTWTKTAILAMKSARPKTGNIMWRRSAGQKKDIWWKRCAV